MLACHRLPFVSAYNHLAALRATQFDDFSAEQFQILGEQQIEDGTIVKTQLVKSDGEKVIINYAVHDNDTSWQIRDVYLAGTISELATRRSDFTATPRSGGIEALIVRLNKKVDDPHRLMRSSGWRGIGRYTTWPKAPSPWSRGLAPR